MPRRPRMYVPGFAYHIVQRGNNRQTCFFEEENYRIYMRYLREVMPRYGVRLHAYCLMTNHVHLLASPRDEDGISNCMKVVCSRYAQYINKKHSRTGTLWEGRHKSCAIDSEGYLLKCYRYIELNPITAGIATRPEQYAWTSHHSNGWGEPDPLITEHVAYSALGASKQLRCRRYREMFGGRLSNRDRRAIRSALQTSLPLGTEQFIEELERQAGQVIGYAHRGRPYAKLVKNKSLRPL